MMPEFISKYKNIYFLTSSSNGTGAIKGSILLAATPSSSILDAIETLFISRAIGPQAVCTVKRNGYIDINN